VQDSWGSIPLRFDDRASAHAVRHVDRRCAALRVEVARDRFGAEIDALGWLARVVRGSCASDLVKVKV
jgi:hypothetical protein